jgi:hypothetical protein
MEDLFKHKVVRDLAWSIQSPCLINDDLCVERDLLNKEYLHFRQHLINLDENSNPLIQYLKSKNTHRLGHYFEQLICYWIELSERFEKVESNIQITDKKKITQGEVDLIVYDKEQGKYQQWELAIKYFLAYKNDDHQTYIGPNANDFLHKKLKKLKNKQCRLLETDAGKAYLNEKGIPKIESKLFVKGCLYYHPKQAYQMDSAIHVNHLSSWWIYQHEGKDFLNDSEEFELLHKKEWLSTPQKSKQLLSKQECLNTINQSFKQSARSLYIACYNKGVLQSTGFVVHDEWPNLS